MTYIVGWAALVLLLGLSTLSAFLHLGTVATALQFAIAASQAAIVFILFMRLRQGPRLKWVFAGAGFYWLAILIVLSAMDYTTRG